jgi:hypothetical protein
MNDGQVRFVGSKGKIGGFSLYIRHAIEDGGFARIGNSDNTALKTHGFWNN